MDNGDDGEDTSAEPVELPIDGVLDLHTFRPADVKGVVQEYLAECQARGIHQVRIIHGKGIGVQREIVRSLLLKNGAVVSFRDAPDRGSTYVVLSG